MIDKVKKQLSKHGYFVETDILTYKEFFEVASSLGTIRGQTDVKVDLGSSAYLKSVKAMSLHNDCVFKGIVAWFCVEQDHISGQTVLVDTTDITNFFSNSEISDLENICVNIKGEGVTPIYRNRKFYYISWAIVPPKSNTLVKILEKFEQYLAHKFQSDAIYVRLEPGQSLFIDDARMLHGRLELSQNSKRFLKRAWIEVQ